MSLKQFPSLRTVETKAAPVEVGQPERQAEEPGFTRIPVSAQGLAI
jgi:hypothetical protein